MQPFNKILSKIQFKKMSQLFMALSFGIVLLIFFQNCAPEEGTADLFGGSTCTDCVGQQSAELLEIEVTPDIIIGLPVANNGTINFALSGFCHDGNFARNVIRWQIRDSSRVLRLSGTTFCSENGGDGLYSIRKSISRTQLSADTYSLELVISGITQNNQEVIGSHSKKSVAITAVNTINPPKLFTINANGTFPASNLWASKLRVETTTGASSDPKRNLNTYLHGLCSYTSGGANTIKIALTKAGAEPRENSVNNIAVQTDCKNLGSTRDGYNGYFFYTESRALGFLSDGIDYEGCASTAADAPAVCRAAFGRLQNRFYDITTSQIDTQANNTLVSDKKVFTLTFSSNPVTPANLTNGKNWNLDIMLELFKRIKMSVDYFSSTDNTLALTQLNYDDLFQAYQIYASPVAYNDDEDKNSSGATLFESYSTRKWVLYLMGLQERRETAATVNPTTPMKILTAEALANTLYKQPLNSLSSGVLCGLGSNQLLTSTNGSDFDSTAANLEAQRIALCITAKFHLGVYYETANLMKQAIEQGVRYTSCTDPLACQCETQTTNTNLSVNSAFCANLKFSVFGFIKNTMTRTLGANKTFSDPSVSEESKMNATKAIGQFMVNAIMANIANNTGGMLDRVTKTVLIEKKLETLQNDISVLQSLRPREENFSTPSPVPFAAYTSFNTPGSAGATGSIP